VDGRLNCRNKVAFSSFSVVARTELYNDSSQRSSPLRPNHGGHPVSLLTRHKNKNKNEFSCCSYATKDLMFFMLTPS